MVDWNQLDAFERHENLSKLLANEGDSKTAVFKDDGKDVKADVIQASFKEKGVKGIKARDTIVFVVDVAGKTYELWLSATNYTALRQLKAVREANGGTLKNAKCKITRSAKGDMTQSTFNFERA